LAAGLHDRISGEILRVVRLQVCRNETHPLLEYLQGHAGLDT